MTIPDCVVFPSQYLDGDSTVLQVTNEFWSRQWIEKYYADTVKGPNKLREHILKRSNRKRAMFTRFDGDGNELRVYGDYYSIEFDHQGHRLFTFDEGTTRNVTITHR